MNILIDDKAIASLRPTRERVVGGETRSYYIHTESQALIVSRQGNLNDLAGQKVEAFAGNDRMRKGKKKLTITGTAEGAEDYLTLSKWLETAK